MNTSVWIIQIMLATAFTTSALIILSLPKKKLESKLSWVREYSTNRRIFICLAKLAGAIGLILPMYLGIFPFLTPLSAVGIVTMMTLAITYHIRKKEYGDLPAPIAFLLLAGIVACCRF